MTEQVSTTDTPAAMVGIDWADQEHAVCLQQLGSGRPEASTLKQTPEAIDEWATALRKRFGGRRVAVCLEQSKGALIYALLKYDFFILYPINPAKLAYYRQAVGLRTRFSNPLRAQLKCYFPQASVAFRELPRDACLASHGTPQRAFPTGWWRRNREGVFRRSRAPLLSVPPMPRESCNRNNPSNR